MKFIYIVWVIIGLSILTSCDKTTPFIIDVSVITSRDALGNPNGSVDNTDWTEDVSWNETEKSLFLTDPIDMTGAEVASVSIEPVYPNPCVSTTTLQFTVSKITWIRIAIVDEKLNKLAFFSFKTDIGLNAYHIPFDPLKFKTNNNYRIYYSFDAPGNAMYYKGHGDVRRES